MTLQPDVPPAYGRALGRAFGEATDTAGILRQWYRIGGERVCVQFAGRALLPLLTPALDHLSAVPGTASLTISAWDTYSTGVPPPPACWSKDDLLPRGEIRGYTDDLARLTWHPNPSVISFADMGTGDAVFWIDDARQTPYYESGSPFRSIFHWWFAQRGWQLLHAAAVGTAEGGVIIAGKGGSGKSNTALSCVGYLPYAADDYCVIAPGAQPFVHSLYGTAKLGNDDVPLYPHLADAIGNAERMADEKALLYLHQHRPQDMIPGFPLRAILVPRCTGQPNTTFGAASAAAALQALAPSTIFQLPGAGIAAFQLLSGLCSQVPCYYLNLGTDRSQIAPTIADILAGAR